MTNGKSRADKGSRFFQIFCLTLVVGMVGYILLVAVGVLPPAAPAATRQDTPVVPESFYES